jgi:putative endonuclease
MTQASLSLGKKGEREGVRHLKKLGFEILDTNVKTPLGEIDVVARVKGIIVFVEIKSRSQLRFGYPEEAVTFRKQRKLSQLAQCYLKKKRWTDKPCRFDVLSVLTSECGEPTFRLIEGAFEVEEA